jgi:hypothetical protein
MENYEPEDIIKIIKEALTDKLGDKFELTPTMYDPILLQYKPTIGIIENVKDDKWALRFNITVNDNQKRKFN